MTAYTLHRGHSSSEGTFGILYRDSRPLCVTCEDPWLDNAVGKSCIPSGRYRVKAFSGIRYQNVWEITGVPGRSAILIHHGNTINDTRGCVLVGRGFATLNGLPSITDSVATLTMLRRELPKEFWLTVVGCYPE